MLRTEMTKHACGVWHPLTTKEADRGSPMGFGAISHDAAYAHALVQAQDEFWKMKGLESMDARDAVELIGKRATEIMRGFGYDTDA